MTEIWLMAGVGREKNQGRLHTVVSTTASSGCVRKKCRVMEKN